MCERHAESVSQMCESLGTVYITQRRRVQQSASASTACVCIGIFADQSIVLIRPINHASK